MDEPQLSDVGKTSSEKMYKKIVKKYKILLISSAVIIFLSILSRNYNTNQYIRAVLKLALMQLMDLNKFKNLLYDSCLLYKEVPEPELVKSDCYTCESIDQVIIINDPEEVLEFYTELEWPVTYKNDINTNITVKDVTFALLNGNFLPCNYESNLKIDPLRVVEIKSGWFMHWRNCDDVQGKVIRSLYRPNLFLSISAETWTIMSFAYKTIHYKKINIYYGSRVAVSQLSGTFRYQLVPKDPCTEMCTYLRGQLEKHHTLIFNSFIWDFQYLPMNSSIESIAFIYYLD